MSKKGGKSPTHLHTEHDQRHITLPSQPAASTDGRHKAGETRSPIRRENTPKDQPSASHLPSSACLEGPQETSRNKGRIPEEYTAPLQPSQRATEGRKEATKTKSRMRDKDTHNRKPSASSGSRERRHKAGRKMSTREGGPTQKDFASPELSPASREEARAASRRKSMIRQEPQPEQPHAAPSHHPSTPGGVHGDDEKNGQERFEPRTHQPHNSPPLSSTPTEAPHVVRMRKGTYAEDSMGQSPSSSPQSPVSPEGRLETGEQKGSTQKDALGDQPPASAERSLLSPTSPVGLEQAGTRVSEQAPVDPELAPFSLPPASPDELQEAGVTTTVGATGTATAPAAFTSPLDHILIFGHGRYQVRVLLCTALAFFATYMHAVAADDLARPVRHWCKIPPEYSSLTVETWKNASLPPYADGDTQSQCFRYEPPLPLTVNVSGNRTMVPCDNGWDYDLGSGVLSIVSEWDLVCGRSWIKTLLDAAYMLGGVVGSPIAGIMADNVGRRPVLVISVFLLVVAGIALPFALTLILFAILRFALSAAAASTLVTSLVLLFEVTDTQHRAQFCGFAVAGALLTGTVYHELVYGVIYNWKIAQIAYMVPTCGLVLVVYLMDESPCLILATSDLSRAERVLMWAAQVNGMDPADFNQRLAVLRLSLEKHVDTAGVLSADSDTIRQEHDVNVFYLMTNKTLCQRSAVIFGCWFLLFGVFYKLTTGDLLAGNLVARTLLLLLRMPGLVGDVFILGRIGRRKSLVASMLALSAGTAALSVALVFFVDEAWLARSLIVLNLLLFDLSAVTVSTYSAELYPTVLRGAGLGLCYSCGRVGALLTPFFNDMMSLVAKGMLYALYAAVLFVFGLLATQLPETTQLQPANTLRDLHAKKWKLSSPLRVARRRSGAAKSTTKLSITVSKRRNRRISCAQPH